MVINHLQNGMILQVGSRVVPTILRGRSNDQPTVKPLMPWHCSTDERIVATKIRFQGYILGAKSRGQSYANPNPPTNKNSAKKNKTNKKIKGLYWICGDIKWIFKVKAILICLRFWMFILKILQIQTY